MALLPAGPPPRRGEARLSALAPALRQRAARAVERGVAYLARVQRPNGEFPILASTDPTLARECSSDPSVFPTALIAWSLAGCPGAEEPRARALAFLRAEMDAPGLWRHWTRDHPQASQLPPDLDDTTCASLAFAAAGERVPGNRALLLANRDPNGRFFTWVAPRFMWTGLPHMRATWKQLAHAPTLWMFFRATSARPRDVDAVVNANALLYLGRFEGEDAVIRHLETIVEEGREAHCDKWYEDPIVLWYFIARALAGRSPRALSRIAAKLRGSEASTALSLALRICAGRSCGESPDEAALHRLLELQQPDGAWPRGPLYHGGRARLPSGTFAPRHVDTPHWGSEALTTGFCLEALAPAAAGVSRAWAEARPDAVAAEEAAE